MLFDGAVAWIEGVDSLDFGSLVGLVQLASVVEKEKNWSVRVNTVVVSSNSLLRPNIVHVKYD